MINLKYCHNHPVNSAHVLSFRPVDNTVKKQFTSLCEAGNSAATARHEYANQLQMKYDILDIEKTLADRSINPNCQDVQRLFQKWRERCIGPQNGKAMFDRLSLEVKQFNEIYPSNGGRAFLQQYKLEVEYKTGLPDDSFEPPTAKVTKISDHVPFILAVVTPLMARAHKLLRQSEELFYCDSTASLDNLNIAVVIVSCSTSAGAIPLGAVMTSSEDAETLSSAFTALVDVLPDYAFFGRGRTVGPLMILTDDSASERKPLETT